MNGPARLQGWSCLGLADRSVGRLMTGRTIRRGAAAAFWVALAMSAPAHADTFTATYAELARSPAGYAASWFSGAVTKDNKFIYGYGHSHASYNNNGLWIYDPATNTHTSVFPSTGYLYRFDKDINNRAISKSGRWAKLDPVANKTLYDYFGGTDIYAPHNRNNHQAFYMPGVNQFWVMAGTHWDNGGWAWGGRFDLKTRRWTHVSKPWSDPTKNDLADFSAGMIAGTPAGWAAANAATAVCPDLDTVVLFGGMSDTWGTVRIIEPNPGGPEPYRWSPAPKAPIFLPAENVRHNAACVGDTVYFVSGQERLPNEPKLRTPEPAPFWKFHVPTRTWAKLTPGPSGAYFTVMTYDAAAKALLVYGGGTGTGSDRLWVYDLADNTWHNLTGTVPKLPRVDHHTGGYLAGFGHVYKGGRRFTSAGAEMDYSVSSMMMKIVLKRGPGVAPPVAKAVAKVPLAPHDPGDKAEALSTLSALAGLPPTPASRDQPIAKRVRDREQAGRPSATRPLRAAKARTVAPDMQVAPSSIRITWTKIPLPCAGISPCGTIKHHRMVEGPGGRVYMMGGDWTAPGGINSGRQEVYSFDPLHPTGDWKLEAPYCGTKENPVHFKTDEAGAVWDAKRGVIWKLEGTLYGVDDACLAEGKSVKAKVIQFNPTTGLWTVPAGFPQWGFWYVSNAVLDPVNDQIVQITDKKAFHLGLETGKWTEYPLWGEVKRFNAIVAKLGRDIYWTNRKGVIERYNLDTHGLKAFTKVPWPVPAEGWLMEMVFALPDRLLVVRPTSGPGFARFAATFDPATEKWTSINQGEGWGNGELILMGGGINGPADYNKQVWVGTVAE